MADTAFEGARERGMGASASDVRPASASQAPGGVDAWASGPHPRRARRVMARGWQRLRLRRRVALLLASVTFAGTLGLGLLADLSYPRLGIGHGHTLPLLGALLIGLLLTGFFALAAVRVAGPLSPPALGAVYAGLDDALGSARQVDAALRTQLARATHQSATARHMMDELRTLTDVANAIPSASSTPAAARRRPGRRSRAPSRWPPARSVARRNRPARSASGCVSSPIR
jgi:hypothetical protein